MDDNITSEPNKEIEQLKTEIVWLKIRLRRIEDFLNEFPSADDYLSKEELGEDELIEDATKAVIKYKKASASFLQRKFAIGYARAAKIMDILEEKGIVGPAEGSEPREVFPEKINEENNK